MSDERERISRLQSAELHGVIHPALPAIVMTNTALGSKALTLNGFTLVVAKHDGEWMIVWRSSNRPIVNDYDAQTCQALLQEARRVMGQGGV